MYSIDLEQSPVYRLLRRTPGWLYLAIIAAVLRLINIGQESLWYDESFTAWLSKLDWPNLWGAIKGDVHPPLWYIVEWINVRLFGTSEIALRIPAALLSVIAVLLVCKLALSLGFERRTAFLAGLLAATLPAAIYYGQDARMYPLLTCCVLLAALAAIRENWLLFVAAAIGTVYTQNLGLFYVLAIGIAAVISKMRTWRSLIKPALAGSATVLAWLPWSQVMLHQAKQISANFWIQPLGLGGVLWPIEAMTAGVRLPETFTLHVYGAVAGITLVSLVSCRKWVFTRSGLIIMSVIFAPLLVVLLSAVWRPVYLPRAFLPSAMALCLLWAYPLRHLSRPNRSVAQAIITPMLLIAIFSHYFPAINGRFPVREWAGTIQDNWQRNDVIYYIAIDACLLFQYYLPNKPYALLPYAGDLNQSLTEETKSAMQIKSESFDLLKQQGYQRIWLVFTTNPLTNAQQYRQIEQIKRSYAYQVVRHEDLSVGTRTIYLVDLVTEI